MTTPTVKRRTRIKNRVKPLAGGDTATSAEEIPGYPGVYARRMYPNIPDGVHGALPTPARPPVGIAVINAYAPGKTLATLGSALNTGRKDFAYQNANGTISSSNGVLGPFEYWLFLDSGLKTWPAEWSGLRYNP